MLVGNVVGGRGTLSLDNWRSDFLSRISVVVEVDKDEQIFLNLLNNILVTVNQGISTNSILIFCSASNGYGRGRETVGAGYLNNTGIGEPFAEHGSSYKEPWFVLHSNGSLQYIQIKVFSVFSIFHFIVVILIRGMSHTV